MKYIILILLLVTCSPAYAQYNPKEYTEFNGLKELVFEDGFDSDKPEWNMLPEDSTDPGDTCIVNTDSIDYKEGIIYLYNKCNVHWGYEAKINIDYTRNFEIVVIAKVPFIDKDTSYQEGILKWNINEETRQYNTLYFSGFSNWFHTHLGLDTPTNTCIGKYKILIGGKDLRNKFVRYTVRKYKNKYYVFVNGYLKGTYRYTQLNGANIGIGAKRNSKAEFDFLGVYYLP